MIKLPSHGELVVKSISYRDRELDLLDPGNCVQEVFLNLNLSHTPFMYYYSLKSYNYINCSKPVVPRKYSSPEIPCLSGPGYHVYSVRNSPSSVAVNQYRSSSCRLVKTVEIPFPYSPYLSDSSFGLRLNWESTGSCKTCTGIGNRGGEGGLLINQTTTALSITIVILFTMATVIWVKIHKYMEQDENAVNAEKLLDDGKSRTIIAG
ncbi:putative RING-H2 finger protein ATL21A [Punica granatum]|nr:putative RING-H2 finger protein ATL21A [Punica granatum]